MASGILATTTEDPVEHYLSAFRFSPLFFEHLEGEGVLYTCVQLFNSGCQDWEVDSHQHGEDAQVEPVRSAALHYSGHDIMPKKRKRWMVYFYMNNQAHDHYYFVIQSQNLFIFFWWGFSDILYPINHTPVARIITSETSHTVRWKEEAFSSSLPLIFFFLTLWVSNRFATVFHQPRGRLTNNYDAAQGIICSASYSGSCLPGGFLFNTQKSAPG